MEIQRFAKPYWGRFAIYRFFYGGTWRKYGYTITSSKLDGWYWTKENFDYACGSQLTKIKEVSYER